LAQGVGGDFVCEPLLVLATDKGSDSYHTHRGEVAACRHVRSDISTSLYETPLLRIHAALLVFAAAAAGAWVVAPDLCLLAHIGVLRFARLVPVRVGIKIPVFL